VLFASHTYIGGPYVVGSHHLAREMGKMGIQVLHVSTPVTPGHAMLYSKQTSRDRIRLWLRPDRRDDNVTNVVPLSLLHWRLVNRLYARSGTNWFVKGTVFPTFPQLLRKYGFAEVDLLLIDQPLFAGIHNYVNAGTTIYRATDMMAEMMADEIVAQAEAHILYRADGLIATSEPVLDNLRRCNDALPALLIRNGVDYEHFSSSRAEPRDMAGIAGPKAIYIGALDERFDLHAIVELARSVPQLQIVLIGPQHAGVASRMSPFPNVHVLGPRSYDELPAYLQHADIGLLPLSSHRANQGRSPMKLYEYAAAGLPVVVRETAELRGREEPFMYFYSRCEQIAAAVLRALADKHTGKVRPDSWASKHSWASKTKQLLEFCIRQCAERR